MNREHVVPSLVLLVICCFLALQSGTAIGCHLPAARHHRLSTGHNL